jgi:hypothetical protein
MSRFVVLCLASAILCAGCGAPEGRIRGAVTFDGKPLPAGRITFFCLGKGRPVILAQITDGSYLVQRAPPGDARITVETFEPRTIAAVDPPPGLPAMPPIPALKNMPTGPYVKIPDRYRRPDQSGLSLTIKGGTQVHDIVLVP